MQKNAGMYTIYIVGASHGARLSDALKKLPTYGTEFTIKCFCVRGARFFRLKWPERIPASDKLIIIPFGNDVQPKDNVKFIRGVTHLTKFTPLGEAYWEKLFKGLSDRLADKSCTIRIIDNFYRYFCCSTHTHSGWVGYQRSINKELKKRFHSERTKVVEHQRLVPLPYRKARKIAEYRNLLRDSVHFQDYEPIAREILKTF